MTKTTYRLQRTWHLDYFNTDYSTKSCLTCSHQNSSHPGIAMGAPNEADSAKAIAHIPQKSQGGCLMHMNGEAYLFCVRKILVILWFILCQVCGEIRKTKVIF